MRFGILGPFEVADDQGRELALGGRKQRAVLAILLLHAGEVVSSDRLIDELWNDHPPATAAKTIQVYVSNLRKSLGDGLLVTDGGGYVLRIPHGQLDVDRFEALVAAGRHALVDRDARTAAARLREALQLWRGPALADFTYESFAHATIARLEEERLATIEERIDADLTLGHHRRLVGELEAFMIEHPTRERLVGQLMVALYRCGRQTDALDVYQRARARLAAEVGLEPGPALRALQIQILEQDDALAASDPGVRLERSALGDEPSPVDTSRARARYRGGGVRSDANAKLIRPGYDAARQQVRFCSAPDGTRIAYALHGRGAPLVRTATWLTHLEFDWESPLWRHWLEGLADGHMVLRYDERGCGLSDRDIEDVSLDARLADLEAVIGAAGTERVALLGISQGGPLAVAFAVRHPERVSHLVLFATFARGRLMRDISSSEREQAQLLSSLIRMGWGQGLPAFRRLFTTLFIPDASPEQMEWFDELQRVTADPETAARIRHARNHDDVTDEARQVACPTLVIHARDDAVAPFAEGRLLATLIPGARFVALESRNHILLADEPAWTQFRAELRNFLGPAEVPTRVEHSPS